MQLHPKFVPVDTSWRPIILQKSSEETITIPWWHSGVSIWFDELWDQFIFAKWKLYEISDTIANIIYHSFDISEDQVFDRSIDSRKKFISYVRALHTQNKEYITISWIKYKIISLMNEHLKIWKCIVVSDNAISIWNFIKDPVQDRSRAQWSGILLYNDGSIYNWNFKLWKFDGQWALRKADGAIKKWEFKNFKLHWDGYKLTAWWDVFEWYFEEDILKNWIVKYYSSWTIKEINI